MTTNYVNDTVLLPSTLFCIANIFDLIKVRMLFMLATHKKKSNKKKTLKYRHYL